MLFVGREVQKALCGYTDYMMAIIVHLSSGHLGCNFQQKWGSCGRGLGGDCRVRAWECMEVYLVVFIMV